MESGESAKTFRSAHEVTIRTSVGGGPWTSDVFHLTGDSEAHERINNILNALKVHAILYASDPETEQQPPPPEQKSLFIVALAFDGTCTNDDHEHVDEPQRCVFHTTAAFESRDAFQARVNDGDLHEDPDITDAIFRDIVDPRDYQLTRLANWHVPPYPKKIDVILWENEPEDNTDK